VTAIVVKLSGQISDGSAAKIHITAQKSRKWLVAPSTECQGEVYCVWHHCLKLY